MKTWKMLPALSFILALSGCSSALKNLNIENPEYRIRDIRPRVSLALPLSASSIDFDFVVEVDNPNSVAINLDQLDFDIVVNNEPIVSGVSRDRIKVPARGIGEVRLRARADYSSLKGLFREVADMIQGERAKYELRGRAYYNTPIGRLNFPVTVYTMGGSDRRRR